MPTLHACSYRNAWRLALALTPLALSGSFLTPRAAAAPAASTTVGDPAHPEGLAQALQDAYTAGARHIVIRRGIYLMPNVGHTAITLQGWQNATISAYGVTLILTDLTWTHDAFDLNGCTDVTLAGVLLSQSQITSYQGRVIAVGKDADGKPYCDWRPDTGYPVPPDAEKGFLGGAVNVVDAHTRLLKIGDGDAYGVPYEPKGDGTFRAHMGGTVAVGDWLVGRYGNAPFKIYLNNSRGCTIKNVTMMRNGFAPLREDGGGGNHYLHVTWALGPRPAGATESPLVTNAADGMHMTGSNPGPDVEGCDFQGVFLDDCIAIHGGFTDVTAVNGSVVTVKDSQWNVGDPIQLADNQGGFQEAKVTALNHLPGGQWDVTLDRPAAIQFVQNKSGWSASGDLIGSKATNPLRNGAGYKIIGCHLGDTRSRGILAKADDGLIRGNVLENCGMSAVSLGPEFGWNEAGYVHNVTVEDNVIRNNGGATYGGAAILVHGDGAIGNQDIVIRDNRLASNYQGDFDVQWVNGITISGNVIRGAAPWPLTITTQTMMHFANAQHITLRGNVVRNAAAYGTPLVAVGADTTDLTNNDATGVRTAAALPK